MAGACAETREYSRAVLRSVFELAGDLGIAGVVVGSGKANPLMPLPADVMRGYFFEALDDLSTLGDRLGVQVLMEPIPPAFLSTARQLHETLAEYGNDRIGVVYDVANGEYVRENITEAVCLLAPRLAQVHLSDTGHDVWRHDPVGAGVVRFDIFRAALDMIDYRKAPILEIIDSKPDASIESSVVALTDIGW